MEPVKRSDHNFVYKGPTPDIGDLSCWRGGGQVWSHWKPTEQELAILNAGGHVALAIYNEPIPPVYVGAIPAESAETEGGE